MGFSKGDRVKVVNRIMGWPVVYGNVGEVLLSSKEVGMSESYCWVRFDEGQQGVDEGGNPLYETETGDADIKRVWLIYVRDLELLPLSLDGYLDPNKPGEKGWLVDQVAEGIDLLRITEELVAQEVGK